MKEFRSSVGEMRDIWVLGSLAFSWPVIAPRPSVGEVKYSWLLPDLKLTYDRSMAFSSPIKAFWHSVGEIKVPRPSTELQRLPGLQWAK